MLSTILPEGCYLILTANQITALPSMPLKQYVDWLELFMVCAKQLAKTVYKPSNFRAHILTRYLKGGGTGEHLILTRNITLHDCKHFTSFYGHISLVGVWCCVYCKSLADTMSAWDTAV